MAFLALDCTGETFSCGLLTEDGGFTEVVGLNPRRALLELPGHIAHLLGNAGMNANQLKGAGVPVGPGSFTGVRLGITLAKTVAFSCGCGILAVDTLECLAQQLGEGFPGREGTLGVALDARRKELYCGLFKNGEAVLPTGVRTPEIFGQALAEQHSLLGLIGSGFEAYPALVPDEFQGPVFSTPAHTALSTFTLCRLTKEAHEAGRLQPFGLVRPEYHRKADIQVSG